MMHNNLKDSFDRYGHHFQILLLKALISDLKFFDEIQELISPELFTGEGSSYIVDQVLKYYKTYSNIPSISDLKLIIIQEKNTLLRDELTSTLIKIENVNVNLNYVKDVALKFCKDQKIKNAIESSVELLENEEYDKIRRLITEATQLNIKKDLGHDYERDVEKRLTNFRKPITTGYSLLDATFDGGYGAGELIVICGGPSTGKSFFLINLAKRALDIGKNVVYITLELAEGLIGKRFDSLISGITINELENRKADVIECVQKYTERTKSKLKIKQYPTKKATVSTLQVYLDLLKRSEGFVPDLLVVDYADILKSNHRGEAKKRFELESVYEELRGLAVELNLPIVTASQANKNSTYSEYVTMADMSESYSKAAISDIVLGINRRADGNLVNYGTIYIAKNRGFGRDGLILPLSYDTSHAKIEIPVDQSMLDKVKAGESVNLAQYWFQKENIQFTNPNVMRFNSPQASKAYDNIAKSFQEKNSE